MLLNDVFMDMELYSKDPIRYKKISEYLQYRHERAYKKFMEGYSLPLPLYEGLMMAMYNRRDRYIHLVKIKAPEMILSNEQHLLGELLEKIKNKLYVKSQEEKECYIKYNKRANQFDGCKYSFKEDFEYQRKALSEYEKNSN